MKSIIRLVALMVTVLLVVGGCGREPVEEVDSANKALEAAVAAGADEYAPQSLADAKDLSVQLEAELAAQEEKFSLFRSYGKSKELAAEMKAAADSAAAAAAPAKDAAKSEASELIAEAKTAIAETRTLLARAPRGKGSEADIRALESDIAAVVAAIGEAESAWDAGQFAAARTKAKACLESLQSIRDSVSEAEEIMERVRKQ